MKGQPESEVLRSCLEYLHLKRIYAWRNNSGGAKIGKQFVRFGMVGSADILGITKDGRFLAVECKREKGGVLSDAQKEFLGKIAGSGGVALCVHSVAELAAKLEENNVV